MVLLLMGSVLMHRPFCRTLTPGDFRCDILSTIENADLILVVNDGEVAEQGVHRELMKKEGLYRRLYEAQFE